MQRRTDPSALFDSVRERYAEAESRAGGALERVYAIGDCRLRLRFAGPALIPVLTPALDHLAALNSRRGTELTVCLWDSASTRTPPSIDTWESLRPGPRGEVLDYSDDRFCTAVQVDAGILSILDRRNGEALYWANSNELPIYERSAPLKVILHWWLREHGYLMIHAGGAALLVGQTGTGKSTAALSCLTAGMRYISDDVVLSR